MILLPAIIAVVITFQQASAWADYERTLRVNSNMLGMGITPLTPSLPGEMPITVWSVMGLVFLIGAILLLVGRETVTSQIVET